MKAEELMIGDYVTMVADAKRFPENIVGETIPCKVIGLDLYKTEGVRVANNFEFMNEDPNKLSPILLTPEILEKNGIKYQYGSPWYQGGDEDGIEIHFALYCQMKLHYVHQLQHALRLCGIEKTIEL